MIDIHTLITIRCERLEAELDNARTALHWFKDFAEAEGDEAMLEVASEGLLAEKRCPHFEESGYPIGGEA